MAEVVRTPVCPLCSQPPVMVLGGGSQAFCGTEDCPAFTWDVFRTVDELMAGWQQVSVEDLEVELEEDQPPPQ